MGLDMYLMSIDPYSVSGGTFIRVFTIMIYYKPEKNLIAYRFIINHTMGIVYFIF